MRNYSASWPESSSTRLGASMLDESPLDESVALRLVGKLSGIMRLLLKKNKDHRARPPLENQTLFDWRLFISGYYHSAGRPAQTSIAASEAVRIHSHWMSTEAQSAIRKLCLRISARLGGYYTESSSVLADGRTRSPVSAVPGLSSCLRDYQKEIPACMNASSAWRLVGS